MPEPFKNQFSEELIATMGDQFLLHWPDFDRRGFVAEAANNLASLELKERSDQIVRALGSFLPDDFEHAADIMRMSVAPESGGISGWAVMPMTHYVGVSGLEHFDLSMNLLRDMTRRFSSEFGIRFLILHDSERALSTMEQWTTDPCLSLIHI